MFRNSGRLRSLQFASLCGLGLILLLLLIPNISPPAGRWYDALWNLLHLPAFFGVTWLLSPLVPAKYIDMRRWLLPALGAAAIGVLTEWIQSRTGRSGSFKDLSFNAIGIALACWCIARKISRGRIPVLPFSVLLLISVVVCLWPAWSFNWAEFRHQKHFPDLGAFSTSSSRKVWQAQGNAKLESAGKGEGLLVSIGPGEFGGVSFLPGKQDWSAFSELHLGIRNKGGAFLLGVRIDSSGPHPGQGKNRVTTDAEVPSGESALRISLDSKTGTNGFDFSRIVRMALYTGKETVGREFVIDSAFLR